MSLTTILNELGRFFSKNVRKLLIGAIMISVLAIIGGQYLPNLMSQSTEETKIEKEASITPDEDALESHNFLANVYEQEPAEFEFFIQLEDGNAFGNSFIFDEYFTSPAIIDEIENQTGINYSRTLKHEENLSLYKTSRYRGSIAGIRDTSSNVITIRVQAAQSSEDNLTLAQAFADLVQNNRIPFTQGLTVTMISEPVIGEKLNEDNLEMVSSPASLGNLTPTEFESTSIILYGIAGLIVGLLISSITLLILQLFKQKITYAFQYSWDFNDYHAIYERVSGDKKIRKFMNYLDKNAQLIVYQESPYVEQLMNDNQDLQAVHSLLEIDNDPEKLDSVTFIIESNLTDKDWYKEQYRLAEMYKIQIIIIHIIN